MGRGISIVLLLFLFISANAQLSEKQRAYMHTFLLLQVNELRKDSGLAKLQSDTYLQRAAYVHSTYMAKNRQLSHIQHKVNQKSALKRVHYVGGTDFSLVGENILYLGPIEKKLSENDLNELAESMFDTWKRSSYHVKNILNPAFRFCAFDFKVNLRTSNIYATQVLGTR